MKIIVKFKHLPREHKYILITEKGKSKYMVGTIDTRQKRLPKIIWDRLP